MTSAPSVADAAKKLAGTFSGQLLQPAEAGYEEARKVHNGLVDKRPALIASCRGVADVVDSVKLGRDLGLEVAVRGGGHNVAGRATVDNGLMIDLALMKGIHVEANRKTVRAQGGLVWLMSKYGFALDNLRSLTLVSAAGDVLQTCPDEHPDLFWALRGGGGNFGSRRLSNTSFIRSGPWSPAASSRTRLITRATR